MTPALSEITISTPEAAELLGLTARRIQQMAAEGVIPRPVERGRHRLVDLVPAALAEARAAGRQAASPAEERLLTAKAEAAEMKVERESKALVAEAVQEAHDFFDQLAGGLRADMIAIPARVTADLTLRRKMETEIDGAFAEAAKRAQRSGGDPPPGAGPAPNRRVRRAREAQGRVARA